MSILILFAKLVLVAANIGAIILWLIYMAMQDIAKMCGGAL